MLDYAWTICIITRRTLSLIWGPVHALANMTLDEKIRFGMIALSGASIVLATLGVHVSPLEIVGGSGMG